MVNKVILIGNLGADPEIKYLQNGMAVANLRLATSYPKKNAQTGANEEYTTWHRLVCYDKTAEFCKYLRKGFKIYIQGRINNREYIDSQDIKRYVTEIVVNELKNLTSKRDADAMNARNNGQTFNNNQQNNNPPPPQQNNNNNNMMPMDDETPF